MICSSFRDEVTLVRNVIAPVVQRVERADNAVHLINFYPAHNVIIVSSKTYPLDIDLSNI